MRSRLMIFVLGLSLLDVMGDVGDFGRYRVILSRRPFGEPPAEPVEAALPSVPAGPSFIESIRLVALTISEGDVRVGFMDTRPNPPKTYFLFVGESQDGIEVVSADYENEQAVLRKAGDERVIQMSSRSGGGGNPGARQLARGGERDGGAREGSSERGVVTPRRLSAARQARIDERRRRSETVPALHGAVLEKHLQEYNMQAIREGAPPLPIPLTPEQDAQLVAEGVLPPLE